MRRIEYVLEIHFIETISLYNYIFLILSDVEKTKNKKKNNLLSVL